MDFTAEQINMAFNNLLEAKSQALVKTDIDNVILSILDPYSLTEDKNIIIKNNVYYVLIGLEQKRDFESLLRKDLDLDINLSRKMVLEIEEKIFRVIEEKTNEYLLKKENDIDGEAKQVSGFSSFRKISGKDLNNRAPLGVESILESRVIDIGKKYKLSIDQLGALVSVTNLVISGEIYASQYRGRLKEKISIDDATFEKIVADVNEEVFKKIRQKMIEEKNEEGFLEDRDIPIPPYASMPLMNRSVFNKNTIPEKKEVPETQVVQPKEPESVDNILEKEIKSIENNIEPKAENKTDIVQEILGSMEHKEKEETPVVIKPVFLVPPEATIPSVMTEPVVTDKTVPVVDKPEIVSTTNTTENTMPVISPFEIPEYTSETSTTEDTTDNKIIPPFIKPITNDPTPIYDTISSPDISQKNEETPVLEPEKTIDNDKTEIPIPNINTPMVEIQNEIVPSPVSQVTINDSLKNVDLDNKKQDVIAENNILVNSGIEIPKPTESSVETENKAPALSVQPQANVFSSSGIEIPIANQEMPDVEIINEDNNTSSTVQTPDISSANIPISLNGQNPINNNVFSSSGIEIPIPDQNTPQVETANKTPSSFIQPQTKEDPIFSQNNSIYADSGVEIIPDNKKSSTDDPYKEVI